MCLGIPGEVIDVAADGSGLATVDMVGVRRTVNVGLLDDVTPRDWVLVHVGFALTKLDEAEARDTLALLEASGAGS
jgi:hydrogenase expression/formation protein HypC